MYKFNKLNIVAIIILSLLFLSLAILTQLLFKNNEIEQQTNLYIKELEVYSEVANLLSTLTNHGRQYILTGDNQYLEYFRIYARNVIAAEEELTITETINELTQAYISFIENEAVPLRQATRDLSAEKLAYLQSRQQDFDEDLQYEINKGIELTTKYLNDFSSNSFSEQSGIIKLLLLLACIGLFILIWSVYRIFTKFSIYNLDFPKLSAHIKHGIIVMDRRGYFTEINEYALDLFGLDAEQFLGRNLNEIAAVLPQMQNVTQPLYAVMMQKKELLNHHVTYFHSGRKLELTVDYIPVFFFNQLRGVILIASHAEKQKDKHLLLDTLEKERKLISIEIHDWIARYLSTIIHSIDYILRLKEVADNQLREQLTTLREHCQNAAIEMRGIMNNIHPYLIDRIGLISALESYINTFEKLNNIKVYMIYQDRNLNIPKRNEIIIYRIIQEALSNIAKHAQATEVDILFTVLHDTLKIEIQDNGQNKKEIIAGKGMWGMKERAKLIGGDIIFEQTDTGFVVALTVPIISGGTRDGQD